MKQLKDIVLTGFLALLAFTACTEEKLIDERPMETGTVSISFSTEGVETKAINAGGIIIRHVMKPRTKYQKQVVTSNKGLRPIKGAQMQWADRKSTRLNSSH